VPRTPMDEQAYIDQINCGGPRYCSKKHMNGVNAKICWKCGEKLVR